MDTGHPVRGQPVHGHIVHGYPGLIKVPGHSSYRCQKLHHIYNDKGLHFVIGNSKLVIIQHFKIIKLIINLKTDKSQNVSKIAKYC